MSESLVPVFVFPNCLKFNVADQISHKQVLTIYNPYDFPVGFQVLCSSKDKHKYTVVDPEGKILTHCCVDIVVRHNAVSMQNVGKIDRFRIQMVQLATNKVIGKKDITAELSEEPERATPDRETFQHLPLSNSGPAPAQYTLPKRTAVSAPSNVALGASQTVNYHQTWGWFEPRMVYEKLFALLLMVLGVRPGPPSGFFISIAIICISTLLLPTAGEVSTLVPEYLKPSNHLKLVVSYVLGLVTMVLLKPT